MFIWFGLVFVFFVYRMRLILLVILLSPEMHILVAALLFNLIKLLVHCFMIGHGFVIGHF
jgi:hypothetical protein